MTSAQDCVTVVAVVDVVVQLVRPHLVPQLGERRSAVRSDARGPRLAVGDEIDRVGRGVRDRDLHRAGGADNEGPLSGRQ